MELDPKSIQLVEHLKEMSGTACESITRPNQHGIETASMRIFEQSVKSRASNLRAAHAMINIFMDNLKAALLGELAQLDGLCLRVLINGWNSHVQGSALHVVAFWGGGFSWVGAAGTSPLRHDSKTDLHFLVISKANGALSTAPWTPSSAAFTKIVCWVS
jgi:hypothetical protein